MRRRNIERLGGLAVKTPTPPKRCTCGKMLDAASGGGQPAPGDLTFCIECRAPWRFDERLELVAVDVATLSAEEQHVVRDVQALLTKFHGTRAN